MPYASDRDRDPHDLELHSPAFPVAPLNVSLTGGLEPGLFDLSWDSPASLAANSLFTVCGVNVYRSFDSELGPFERLTQVPIGSVFYRDRTDNVLVVEEIVDESRWLLKGECTTDELNSPRYVFKTMQGPIVQSGSQAVPDQNINEVRVTIDGLPAKVLRVVGETGEVELDTREHPNVATQKLDAFPIPTDTSVVKVTYRYNRSLLKTDLGTRVFYRLTTVGVLVEEDLNVLQNHNLLETPLDRAALTNSREIEKLDWIWKESVRRNRWILQQGGERVRAFIRKTVGEPCSCTPQHTHKQALSDCIICFGTGFIGGYEGPYDIIVAPDDAERRLNHAEVGLNQEHVYEVWTGPSPLLSQRDFIVKINGERYSIGPVRMPSNRGMLLQQHFNIGYFDEKDIRYRVPIDGVKFLNEVGQRIPPASQGVVWEEKPGISNEREIRGRTVTYENITY